MGGSREDKYDTCVRLLYMTTTQLQNLRLNGGQNAVAIRSEVDHHSAESGSLREPVHEANTLVAFLTTLPRATYVDIREDISAPDMYDREAVQARLYTSYNA